MNSNVQTASKKLILVLLGSFFLFLAITLLKNSNEKSFLKKVETFKGETIGYAIKYKKVNRGEVLMYSFYVNGKKNIAKAMFSKYDKTYIGNYFKVKYNIANPNQNHILLNFKIKPDSLTLVKTGFKKVKKYYYDHITNTYKEKTEWE